MKFSFKHFCKSSQTPHLKKINELGKVAIFSLLISREKNRPLCLNSKFWSGRIQKKNLRAGYNILVRNLNLVKNAT